MLGQNAVDKLQTLVQLSGRRLALAELVAFAKWDGHNSIEDPSREVQVIRRAIKEGESRAWIARLSPGFSKDVVGHARFIESLFQKAA